MHLAVLIFCLAAFLKVTVGGEDHKYNYDQDGKDWKDGQCSTGRSQSPIILYGSVTKNYDPKSKDPIVTWNYEKMNMSVAKGEYSIYIKPNKATAKIGISGGDLKTFYKLDHIHMHWESEHIIAKSKKRHTMEVHFVHYKSNYDSVADALSDPDGLAVLGAMYKIGDKNAGLEKIMETIKNTKDKSGPMKNFDALSMLPKDLTSYYRYSGSLTTPACTEAVVWTVFANVVFMSSEQADWLKTQTFLSGGSVAKNYRYPQEINDREIFGVGLKYMYYVEGGQARSSMSLSLTVFFILLWSFN